jgi:exocyst complex component 4
MADDSCIPVQVALQLMDTSSLGRAHQYGQFQDTHKQLRRALKAIVNEHHQGFNSSIGTFHTIQTSIQTSQTRLRNLKDSLAQSRVNLSSTKPELKVLASASQGYDEMLQVLSTIEKLRSVMEKLEARISEKRFLSAVEVLQDALKLLRRPDMDNIGALSDLRVYLANQESSLTDILIEELHSHLYLRSPYCQDRWKAHAREQSSGASVDAKDGNVPAVQPLWQYLESDLISAPTIEDPAKNPESNSFYYIQLLLESLHKMDRLAIAVNAIEQRMPVELFKVVDKTNNEVDQRHPTSMRSKRGTSTGKADLSISDGDARALVIYDLLWTLYAKFEAIAEGHRVLHDVVSCIAKRDNLRNHDVLTGSFKELWMLYQNEIRSLLHDYLATDSNMYRMSVSMDEDSTVFRRGTRRKDKKLFHLSDTDPKSVEMKTEFEDLESILKASVPGLVSGATQSTGVAADEKHQQTDGAATGHKLLIEPSVFNMALLLPPSLAFLQRLKDIVPPGPDIKTSLLTSFLDDFLVNVFLPQLDETLMKMSSQVFNDANAFQEEAQWAQVAKRPIFHGASAFLDLVTAFCKMLATIPHDQAFSQLIITQMAAYYEKCNDWYKSVVARSADSTTNTNALKTSAMLAIGPGEIHDLLHKASLDDSSDQKPRHRKEVGLLLASTKDSSLELQDVIMDRKSISSLCLLYTSMKWLSVQVSKLRRITTNDIDSSRRTQSMRPTHNRRWTLINAALRAGEEKSEVYLPMTQETVS